jgi:hypothetical protein
MGKVEALSSLAKQDTEIPLLTLCKFKNRIPFLLISETNNGTLYRLEDSLVVKEYLPSVSS